jgi:hypothetical protein
VLRLRELSECSVPRAAAIFLSSSLSSKASSLEEIINGDMIITSAFNTKIEGNFETSPVVQAYLKYRDISKDFFEEPLMVSSYFPSIQEFLFLSHTELRTVYYMGVITDGRAVRFLNDLTKNNPDKGFEIIKIKIN